MDQEPSVVLSGLRLPPPQEQVETPAEQMLLDCSPNCTALQTEGSHRAQSTPSPELTIFLIRDQRVRINRRDCFLSQSFSFPKKERRRIPLVIQQPEEVEATPAVRLADPGADTESNKKLSSSRKDQEMLKPH